MGSYPEQLKAVKRKRCPACGSNTYTKLYPDGWRVLCGCGATSPNYEDGRDADLWWNAWAIRCEKRRAENS